MSELNFKPATLGGHAGDRSVAVPALNAGALATLNIRAAAHVRHQRKRLNRARLSRGDTSFRLFRVF